MPESSRSRKGLRALSATIGLGMVAAPIALVSTPAQAADPVQINLLGVNDFHGRINANTVKWAGTVEQLTEGAEDSTLLVGAGDLIGASEFASAVADDQPTIDMFNALGLDASAVGNHEFDKGFDDLTQRVIGAEGDRNAQWDYLGANVYQKGTTTPALPEYTEFDVNGVDVAVVGAVTEETKSLVSPGGISELDFGDPVEAVNRVAGELSDGDDSNGEAQVIVASFHSGAQVGADSTYEEEVAKGGEFAEMADLDPAVDVILNGHTHQTYAWDAPIPGEPGKTRPIIQTGSYGANVGQIELSVDPATGDVLDYDAQNVARTTESDDALVAKYPRVAKVEKIVDDAIAHASEVGNQPVGSITDSITTAFTGGEYTDGTYTGGTRDDRGSESTLGDLVGNALRDGIPSELGTPDLGITNPGGLRAELEYAGDTTDNPANTDGVVTYAEANSVLPFVNNIWLVKLKGSDLESVLEQQWQPEGKERPYLALGLSDNVRVTQDPTKPAGSRITGVWIDGQPLDADKTYTVSTFSFLGTGGDNFTAFTNGTPSDTGLVDRELWIGYLKDHPGLSPDFARQEVHESGMPQSVPAGDAVTFTLSNLDLTSQGSPKNTSVSAYLTDGARSIDMGDFPVAAGSAAVAFTAPTDLDGTWQVGAVAKPSGTVVGAPMAGEPAATTTVKVKAKPHHVVAKKTRVKVTVKVKSDETATGTVTVKSGGKHYTAKLKNGKAKVRLKTYGHQGDKRVRAFYSDGDQTYKDVTTVHVVKKHHKHQK